jgi:hypothetical protein
MIMKSLLRFLRIIMIDTAVGGKYYRLTIESFAGYHHEPSGVKRDTWMCLCECGNTTKVIGKNLRTSHTRSCGCYCKQRAKEASTTHGMYGSPTYITWQAMKQRCYDANASSYNRYGALGVTVCERWRDSFENFLEDMGEKPTGASINRVHGAKIYCIENCEWATTSQQSFDREYRVLRGIGVCGVTKSKYSTWRVTLGRDYLGTFKSFEEAVKMRREAEVLKYGFPSRGYTEDALLRLDPRNSAHKKKPMDEDVECSVEVFDAGEDCI